MSLGPLPTVLTPPRPHSRHETPAEHSCRQLHQATEADDMISLLQYHEERLSWWCIVYLVGSCAVCCTVQRSASYGLLNRRCGATVLSCSRSTPSCGDPSCDPSRASVPQLRSLICGRLLSLGRPVATRPWRWRTGNVFIMSLQQGQPVDL